MIKIFKNKFFKLLLISLLLLFIFTSCDKNEEQTTTAPVDETVSSEIKDETETQNHNEEENVELTSFDFMKANSLINAISNYKTVKITSTSYDNTIYIKSFFMHGEKPVMIESCKNEDEEELFGWYDGYDLKITEDGVVAEKYVETMLDAPSFYYEDEISLMFDGKEFSLIEETDEAYIFNVTYPQMDVREKRVYTVSKSSLLLQKAEIMLDDEPYDSISYEYGVVLDDYGLENELDGNYKTISFSCVLSDGNAEISTDLDLPEGWEFIPLHRVNQLSIYLTEDFSEEYAYPGDGISFSMFCTDSVG